MVATKSFALKGGGENDPTTTRSLLICGKISSDLVLPIMFPLQKFGSMMSWLGNIVI